MPQADHDNDLDWTTPDRRLLPVARSDVSAYGRRHDDKIAVLHHSRLADMREEAANLREDAADLRETKISQIEAKQAELENHRAMLQQVNEHLVIATIQAQELAEQLYVTQAQLENAKFMAEKANLAKSHFLSNMSHELRTPLNAILGFAQLLETGFPPLTDAQNNRLQPIIKGGWYLLELINEILDLSMIESGKLLLLQESVPLFRLLSECMELVEPLVKKQGIRLSIIPCDASLCVNADHTRLKQVVLNLLSNAIKYNREQGTVEVSCIVSTERIRIVVKDSGAGLSPEMLEQLFQPFNRLDQRGSAIEGTGIGLVVTKRLVELMGGTIGVKSTVGMGSTFWFDLIRNVKPEPTAENITQAETDT